MGRESNAAELLELAHLVLVLLAIQRDRMSPRNLAALLVNETVAPTPVMVGSVGIWHGGWLHLGFTGGTGGDRTASRVVDVIKK